MCLEIINLIVRFPCVRGMIEAMSNYLDNLELFDEESVAQGKAIFANGGVKILSAADGTVEADVESSPTAHVVLKFTPLGEMMTCKCSCGSFFCPHMAAVIHCLDSKTTISPKEEVATAKVEDDSKLKDLLSSLRDFLNKRNFAKTSQTNDEFIAYLWPLTDENKATAMKQYFTAVGDVFYYDADISRLLPYVSDAASKSKLSEDALATAYQEALEEGGANYAKYATALFIHDPSHSFAYQKGLAAAAEKIGFYKPLPDSLIYSGNSDILLLPELAKVCMDHVPFAFPYGFLVEQLEKFAQRKDAVRAVGYLRLLLKQEPYWVAPEYLARFFAESEVKDEAKEIFKSALSEGRDISSYVNFRLFLSDEEFKAKRKEIFALIHDRPYYEGCVFYEGEELAGEEYGKLNLSNLTLAEIYRGLPRAKKEILGKINELVEGRIDTALKLTNPSDDNGVIYLIKDLTALRSKILATLSEDPRMEAWAGKEPSVRALLLLAAKALGYLDTYDVREYKEGN